MVYFTKQEIKRKIRRMFFKYLKEYDLLDEIIWMVLLQ